MVGARCCWKAWSIGETPPPLKKVAMALGLDAGDADECVWSGLCAASCADGSAQCAKVHGVSVTADSCG
jgi:hypothetical protein